MKNLLITVTLISSLFSFSSQASIIAEDLMSGVHGRNQVKEFTFTNLADHNSVSINFDLMMWDSWDGDHWWWGSDTFGMRVDGNNIFEYTFSNFNRSAWAGTNPYEATRIDHFGRNKRWKDYFYEDYANGFDLAHNSSDLSIEFYSTGLQRKWDESWEVRNLDISSVPEPSVIALFTFGLIGIGFIRTRKTQASL